ncbi:BRO-N domain-containing protein [Agrobacterium tumefaciens]|uniref:BRO-N domain-containing protein n=1 Tax=Agrobacterium tumefaciens TaxID=358 RepID=UPI003CC80558
MISESGLYKLIMRSDKPEARKFQDWVTRDVLPAIRKTGGYLLNEEAPDTAKADDGAGMPQWLQIPSLERFKYSQLGG